MARVPVAEGIFTWPADAPKLIGSRCTACGIVTFPAQDACPRCARRARWRSISLARRGRLWAWTTQEFPPPSPPYAGPTGSDFVPFGVGLRRARRRGASGDPAHRVRPRRLATGMEMELVLGAVPHRRRRQRGRDVRVPARDLRETDDMTMDVAIVGVGLHPFGRFPGVSGDRDGCRSRSAARSPTPASSGATSSSRSAAATRSTTPTRWSRSSASRASRSPTSTTGARPRRAPSTLAANTIRLGDYDLGIAVGMDKHLPGAFSADPRLYACPSWYGELGQFVTTKFFGMKINKYMHDHGISHETLAKVAAKNYRNGALNPNAFRRKPLSEEEILGSPMLNYPLTQYMFCSPDEGAAAVVLCRAEHAHRYTDTPIYLRATTVRTRRLGAFEVHSPWLPIEETVGPTVDASRAAYDMAGIGPDGRRRDPAPGHRRRRRGDPPGRERLLRRRRPGGAGRRRRARDRRLAAGEHRRRADRQRRADRRVGPAPGPRSGAAAARPGRRPPGSRQPDRSATPSSTARPAPRACRSCRSDRMSTPTVPPRCTAARAGN